jgi:adenylate cyclase
MSSSADAVRRLVANALLRPGDSEDTLGLRYAQAVDRMGPLVPRILDHQFRAHLRDGIRRELATGAEREAGALAETSEVAIAFADLVGYTRLGEQLPAESLGRIAGRLSELAIIAVRRPVRLVKMIGDAAMFMSPEVPALVATIAALVESVEAEGPEFPSIRVGITYGPATTRGGDWFGATVNTASRITDLAKPGAIVATEAVVAASPEYAWRRRRRRGLKGVEGRVRLFVLDGRAGAEVATPRVDAQ